MKRALLALVLITSAPPALAQQQAPAVFVRPLASLLLPGTGQLLGHQDRGAVYLAAEVYLVSRFLQLDRDAVREAQRYQNLAFEVARRPFSPVKRDTVFEYYEQMERFTESGVYDADPGPGFAPESDPQTYNGSVWLLARRTFWQDPNVPPDPSTPEYNRARQFYWDHAVGPGYQWSWRDHSLEHQVYRATIRRSDDAFRSAQNQIGLLLANHIISAVDALISARLASVAGRPAEMHTMVTRGRADIRFSVAF